MSAQASLHLFYTVFSTPPHGFTALLLISRPHISVVCCRYERRYFRAWARCEAVGKSILNEALIRNRSQSNQWDVEIIHRIHKYASKLGPSTDVPVAESTALSPPRFDEERFWLSRGAPPSVPHNALS